MVDALGVAAVFCIAGAVSITLLLAMLGLLWSPGAALTCGRMARSRGLNVSLYAKLGIAYSLHLFLPYFFLSSKIQGKAPPTWLTLGCFSLVFTIWLFGAVGLSIGYLIAYFQSYADGSLVMTSQFGLPASLIVSALLVSLVTVTLGTWVTSAKNTYFHLRRNNSQSQEPALESVLPEMHIRPLTALWVVVVAQSAIAFSVDIWPGAGIFLAALAGAFLFVPIGLWMALVRSIRREHSGMEELAINILPSDPPLRPFAYCFMWLVVVLWSGAAYWLIT